MSRPLAQETARLDTDLQNRDPWEQNVREGWAKLSFSVGLECLKQTSRLYLTGHFQVVVLNEIADLLADFLWRFSVNDRGAVTLHPLPQQIE